jgi:hypothetical protein
MTIEKNIKSRRAGLSSIPQINSSSAGSPRTRALMVETMAALKTMPPYRKTKMAGLKTDPPYMKAKMDSRLRGNDKGGGNVAPWRFANKPFSACSFIGVWICVMTILFIGCSSTSTGGPKETVIAFFGAMEKDDRAAIANMLDLGEMMKKSVEDYALSGGEPRVFTTPEDILNDLTGEGETKKRWFALQRIVASASMTEDVANVEVTFVDKVGSKGYRTEFGLHKVHGRWKIFSFANVAK